MPTLNKPTHKKSKNLFDNERGKRAQQLYNTTRWRKLRQAKLQADPLCEMCLKEGRVTPATEVHHIVAFMSVDDPLLQQYYCYNPNNVMSLCTACHHKIHMNLKNQQ